MRGGFAIATARWLALAWLAAAVPATAGTIYRCDSPDGSLAYVSKRLPGAKCRAVSSYAPPRASGARSSPAPAAAAATTTAATPARAGRIIEVSGGGDDAAPESAHANAPATFMADSGDAAGPPPGAARSTVSAPAVTAPARSGNRVVQGEVYSFVKDGVRHYTSRRPARADGATALRTISYRFIETCYACEAKPGVNFGTLRLNYTAFQAEVQAAAREFGVDEAVIRAIMHAESAFNPNALSRVGAQGLMQLMPATARRFGVANAFDPGQNIRGGVEYLAWLLKRFNGDLTLASAGYNAGEGAVDRHKGVPPYSETRRYVERVAVLAERYRSQATAAN